MFLWIYKWLITWYCYGQKYVDAEISASQLLPGLRLTVEHFKVMNILLYKQFNTNSVLRIKRRWMSNNDVIYYWWNICTKENKMYLLVKANSGLSVTTVIDTQHLIYLGSWLCREWDIRQLTESYNTPWTNILSVNNVSLCFIKYIV